MFRLFKNSDKNYELVAPVTGQLIDITKVPDKVFAEKMMGEGIAFQFEGNTICSPCEGTLTLLTNTLHAFGITSEHGAEILVHIGLDTVNLNGKGFKALVKQGMKVSKGMPIIEIDRSIMMNNDIDLITPMVMTNCATYDIIIKETVGNVIRGETVVVTYKKK